MDSNDLPDVRANPNYTQGGNQNITMILADGLTPYNISLAKMTDAQYYNTRLTLCYGMQAGFCIVLLGMLLTLTRGPKLRTPLFLSSIASLGFGVFRNLFLAIYFLGDFCNLYVAWTGDARSVSTSSYVVAVAATVFPLLMTLSIFLSLGLMVRAVTQQTLPTWLSRLILGVTVVSMIGGIVCRCFQMVVNDINIIGTDYFQHEKWRIAGQAIDTFILWFVCLVFLYKMVLIIRVRKENHWKALEVNQMLAIGAICTMILPSIFASIQWRQVRGFEEAGSFSMTLTALCLPWCALFSGMKNVEQPTPIDTNFSRMSDTEQENFLRREARKRSIASTAVTDTNADVEPANTTTIDAVLEPHPRPSEDSGTELQGITVERTYGTNEDAQPNAI